MAYRMVLIGYLPEEFASARQKWAPHPFILDYADSPERADLMQDVPQVDLAAFHSRMLDSIPYITVMRSHGFVPFLVVTPEHTNMQQTQNAVKQIFEVHTNAPGKQRRKSNRLRRFILLQRTAACPRPGRRSFFDSKRI